MTSPVRACSRVPALAVAVLLVGILSACGTDSAHHPDALPSSSTETSSTAEPTDAPPSTASHDATPGSGGGQMVEVPKFGIAFELPKGWITLDAKKLLEGGAKNPVLDEMADRLGTSREQLAQALSTVIQTMSVSGDGAVNGFLDNVNTTGQDGDVNDEQLKLQLATLGAKPGTIAHATSDAGDLSIVHYTLRSEAGRLISRAVALAVRTEDATMVITVSSSSDERATKIAHQIQASLKKIPGTGPNA